MIRRIGTLGAAGRPPSLARQIALTNQTALLATLATVPYQVFYVLEDFGYYLPIFLVNVAFIGLYAGCVGLNRLERFDLARNVALTLVYAHLFVATSLISTAAGVHLFYLTLGASLGLIFEDRRERRMLALLGLAALLFAICHFAFPPGSTPLEIPTDAVPFIYTWSATGAILLAGGLSILFRTEIDRAESALTRSNAMLHQLSRVDPLTGLANRRTLDVFLANELSRASRYGQPISLLLSDVDHFKEYNDHYGHVAGDECLRRVAEVFVETAGRAGDLAARFGGEEFALVLTDTDESGALELAERLRQRVAARELPHERSTVADVVTVSIGVATIIPGGDDEPRDLVGRADEALYGAKHAGRNRVGRWLPPAVPRRQAV